jgi:hypothetical protein
MLYKNAYSEILATNLSSVSGTVKSDVNQVQFTLVAGESGDDDEPTPTLATPTNLSAIALSETEIRLSWDAVDGAAEYNIYEGDEVIGTLVQTSVDMTDLDPGTEYCFSVSAIIGGEETAKSEEVCETTLKVEGIVELTSSINVYPNPVNDRLYIETEVEVREVVVYDVFGRQQTTDNGQQTFIDVTNLNNGIYFVKVVTENGEVVKRFVKK